MIIYMVERGYFVYTVFLRDAIHEPIEQIGSKAMHLSNIIDQAVTIPNGFVIKASALQAFMRVNDLHSSDASFEQAFHDAALPEEMIAEIMDAFAKLQQLTGDDTLHVAVRSSSSAEDLEDASFAGQYDTILNVQQQGLVQAVKACWQSVFSAHAASYAQQQNISLDAFPMGVLVQQMVEPDVSGVIFSMNPITESKDELIINASYGLGEAVVSGMVTPDTFIVHKETKAIERDLGLKEMKIIGTDDGLVEITLTEEESDVFCLRDEAVLQLADMTVLLEAFYQYPVDIEFAVKNEQVYVLQSRPVTA